jgi:hypothetical protein
LRGIQSENFAGMSKCVAAGRHHSEAKGISMFIIYIIVMIVTAAANAFAAVVDLQRSTTSAFG